MAIYRFRKDALESDLNRNAIWAIVYGDMMSYLMVLFLMMLSYNMANIITSKTKRLDKAVMQIQRVFGGVVDPKIAARAQQRDKEFVVVDTLRKGAEEGKFGDEASLIINEQRIQLNLGSGILFDSGKSELREGALPILKAVSTDMLNVNNEIRVEGHTDNIPIGKRMDYKSNWELSMARAYSVIRALESFGVDPKRLSGVGYGEHRPTADNATREGRIKNRRISINLSRVE